MRRLKLRWLAALDRGGAFRTAGASRWRARRLAILCYHGVSKADEHEWDADLYMPAALLQSRLELLRAEGCTVVPLDEGLRRLRDGTLPARAVAVTFDDGLSDFCGMAWPVLQRARVPATVYLTSYYSAVQLPIFNLFCSYILWAGQRRAALAGAALGLDGQWDIRTPAARVRVVAALRDHCRREATCAVGRHDLALRLASELGVDVGGALADRRLFVLSADEVRQVSSSGADVQLHTHRHRMPAVREQLYVELDENRRYITELTGRAPDHFCYPSGVWRPELFGWLAAFGVASAVVGEKAYATAATGRMQLPRFVDTCGVTPLEFRAWVTGAFALLPPRRQRPPAAA
jgi:peptidoglycan/xylan/chitin deacetylase (PgdA/CDA1 family)